MTTTTIYPIAGYPTIYLTTDGAQMTIRPMVPEDKDELLDFFRRIPPADRFGLKEDVTDPKVMERWALTLDYSRALPLLAILDGQIVGDATLHHRRAGSRQHIGEVRVVVDPNYRNRGVGRGLLHKLIDIAGNKGLKKLMFEVIADTEEAARQRDHHEGFGHVRRVAMVKVFRQRHAPVNQIIMVSLKLCHTVFDLALPLRRHLNIATLDLEFHRCFLHVNFLHHVLIVMRAQHSYIAAPGDRRLKDRHVVFDLAVIGQARV
jgi:GNAT superfamily N-acetyltransferase